MKLHCIAAAACLACSLSAGASTNGMVISQVYGGGGSTAADGSTYLHDFVELRNAGSSAQTLTGWSLQYGSSTSTGAWSKLNLPSLTLAAGQFVLVQLGSASTTGTALPTPDVTSTALNLSASAGKVALVNNTTALSGADPSSASIIDMVGYGAANGHETAPTAALDKTKAALRAGNGCTDTDNNSSDFSVGAPAPRNSSTSYSACADGGGAGDSGGGSGATARTIPEIQGSASTSAYDGQQVSTSGVVTLLTNTGFFLQDPSGDGNSATSDGIYVYLGSAPTVAVGQLVSLTGTVKEFNVGAAGNTDTSAHPVTELISVSNLSTLGSGHSITPVSISLPEGTDHELERYEGMLVTVTSPLTVAQNYFQGRFGQVTLAAGGRMETPTNAYRPGTAQALALADLNARSRLILDDASSVQNPNPTPYIGADNTLRAGDTVAAGLTGVIDYGLATSSNTGMGDWKLHPTQAPSISRSNARTATPSAVGGNLKVASFNVLNYFTTFTNGATASGQTGQGCTLDGASAASNCRGADNADEFGRQRAKIIEAIAAINADVVGMMEMQNNGSVAVQNLVDGLNAKLGAGTYAVVPDPASGVGTDAIKVAMIYKPAVLSRSGNALSDTDAIHNRPPLAQVFAAANGEKFAVVVNHFKSKGSCPASGDADYSGNFDSGDGQGCWNARRVQQAQRLRSWIASSVTPSSADVLVLGDLNAYAKEDPVYDLTGNGWVDQIARYNSFGYSYVFDGAAGRLDHALASASLSPKVTRAIEWHINADEPLIIDYNTEFRQPACASCGPDYYSVSPYRSSDHDPVVMGLELRKLVQGSSGRDTLVGSAGDDRLIGGGGADRLTGGLGADLFVYQNSRDAADTITDFSPGSDKLDLSALLQSLGWNGSDAVSEGWLRVIDSAQGAVVQIDSDGPASANSWRPLATLTGVSAAQLNLARDVVLRTTPYSQQSSRQRRIR